MYKRIQEEIVYYGKYIEEKAKNNDGFQFYNNGVEYSNVILSQLLKTSEGVLRLYTESLKQKNIGTPGIIELFKQYIEKDNNSIRIVIDNVDSENSETFNTLKFLSLIKPDKISIRKPKVIDEKIFMYSKTIEPKQIYFVTGGEFNYELEYDINLNHSVCSFNDEKTTKQLIYVFDNFFDSCVKF